MRQQTKPFIIERKPSANPSPTLHNCRSGEGWMLTLHKVSRTNMMRITRPRPVVTARLNSGRNLHIPFRLQRMQEAHSALRMGRRLKNRPLVVGQNGQP